MTGPKKMFVGLHDILVVLAHFFRITAIHRNKQQARTTLGSTFIGVDVSCERFFMFQTVSNGNLMSREVDENRKKYSFEMEKNLFLCQKNFLDVEKTCSGYVKHSPTSSEQARKKITII